jgi:uncharacterized protein
MKKILFTSLCTIALTACSTSQESETSTPKLGAANPASKYCVDQGGKLEIRTESNGQVGYCHLKNGKVDEEWAFFRKSQNGCSTEKAKELVGKNDLPDDEIKKLTNSSKVRRLVSGHPITSDFRENRVNITINQFSKKIIYATCG